MRHYRQAQKETTFSILTLDDDPIMTSTVQAYFQRSGYRVDVENDPNRAIERIRNDHYDILLLDYLMPPICGDQVVEQVRAFNRDLFIIMLTGHKDLVPPIKTIRALDIQGYYEKSDRFDQLELLVESCAKSIRQMRTIRSYQTGLTGILNSLPELYRLGSLDQITDHILNTAHTLLPCTGVVLTLDTNYDRDDSMQAEPNYVSRSVGDVSTLSLPEALSALLGQTLHPNFLVQGNLVSLPLLDNEQTPMGMLSIAMKETPKYEQVQLLEVFGRQVASAMHNAYLHNLIQEKNHQLKNGYLEMVSTMRLVGDAKDPYTRGHPDRVSYYASHIARRLGRSDAYCEQIRIAGLFHDVGKLSVPDDILLKNGRLTDEEYAVIKGHPAAGEELLSVLTQFRPILPAIRSHHERFDGTGYPDNLRGTDIPEAARIIAVADTFDAMTSDRQYRPSLGYQRAMEELERCKGTQLDGEIVCAFQELVSSPQFWQQMRQDMKDCTLPDIPFSI